MEFMVPQASRSIRFGIKFGCEALYKGLVLALVTDVDASVFGCISTRVAALNSCVLSSLPFWFSLSVPELESLCNTVSGSDRGLYSGRSATEQDRLWVICLSTSSYALKPLLVNNFAISSDSPRWSATKK